MKNGFTLIELIAVISIIAVLSIMIIPRVVDSLNEATDTSMIISENEILDAASLYLEDYCRNPIDDEYRSHCNTDRHLVTIEEGGEPKDKAYFCLSTLQGRGIIKETYYKETTSCKGIVMYDYQPGKYTNPKVYLYCEDDYTTEGGRAYKSYVGSC